MRWTIVALGALTLAGCASPRVITRERSVAVSVPVPQPCAAPRPDTPAPMASTYPDARWRAMDVRQKAAALGRQTLILRGYGEQLDAATAACPQFSTERTDP